ncbi:hypothetical protein ACH5RR_005196 [Cinchona calisaya]|uniref:Uncharacterized protein n=1 Tax=Cinchona calisaya TaxID=153742 RepID=A0ABD3AKG5_9GENT
MAMSREDDSKYDEFALGYGFLSYEALFSHSYTDRGSCSFSCFFLVVFFSKFTIHIYSLALVVFKSPQSFLQDILGAVGQISVYMHVIHDSHLLIHKMTVLV